MSLYAGARAFAIAKPFLQIGDWTVVDRGSVEEIAAELDLPVSGLGCILSLSTEA